MPFTHRTKEESLEEIKNLVRTFTRNYKSYTSKDYDEANTRTDFIDKFFEALNWDVRNDGAKAERFREVVREDKVKIADQTKAPDYSFRIGGQKIFFVEAKKPSVNIKEDEAPAFQVRRYAYTAKLPLSILTDFEEFAVYDTKIKPAQKDNASVARIKYIRYDDYEKEFDFLWNTFSKQAVENGSFDNYAEETGGKKGTGEIDSALLDLIETWRLSLAKNIALRNESLTLRNLNAAVQKIIDRIIFLRIAEDKEMENYATLQNAAKGADIYGSLKKIFLDADKKYNSGIFKNESWINALLIDDKILKEIIDELYYPKCPYVWAALPVEILGNIYEKFLGSEITFKNIKGGHTASVEQKPEIKKAGGVFYTPRYIVEYIVSQTLGKKLENLSPKEADKITVLDPACGSGSFLVGAYKYLLSWYFEQYTKDEKSQKTAEKSGILISTTHGLALSIEEKKRILTGHIFGVDIDSQAVEVTKLSLFLQMLEGEGKELHGTQSDLFRSSDLTILPDMSANIRCGNSLIASDFYADAQGSLFDDEAMIKVNAFNWSESFGKSAVLGTKKAVADAKSAVVEPVETTDSANGHFDTSTMLSNHRLNDRGRFFNDCARFDVIIGNPPYLRVQGLHENHEGETEYLQSHYESATGRYDFYILFMEKGFSLLNKDGILSFILPHKFINSDFGTGIRNFIYKNKALNFLTHFGAEQVFEKASVYTCVVGLSHGNENFKFAQVNPKELSDGVDFESFPIEKLSDTSRWSFQNSENGTILEKLAEQKDIVKNVFKGVFQGVVTGDNKVFYLQDCKQEKDFIFGYSAALEKSVRIEKEICKPILTGKTIERYGIKDKKEFLIYPYFLNSDGKTTLYSEKDLKNQFPSAYEYLASLKKRLSSRGTERMKYPSWYSLWNFRNINNLTVMRILTPDICYGTSMYLDDGSHFHNDTSYAFILENGTKEKYLYYLAILNSPIVWFYLSNTGTSLRGGYFRFKTKYLENFPLPPYDEKSAERLTALADAMLSAAQKEQTAVSEEDKRIARQRINALDAQINAAVYRLYGLSAEEIAVVENAR